MLLGLENTLKWVERLILCLFIAGLYWFVYIYFCKGDCRSGIVGDASLLYLLQWSFPISALIGLFRIGVVFRLNDNDDEPEYLFYASLVCFGLAYVFFWVFMFDFIANSQKALTGSFGFMLTVVTFLVAAGSLLLERQTWDKSAAFVKARIVLALLHFTLLLINPVLGILSTVFFAPVSLLWPIGKIHHHK